MILIVNVCKEKLHYYEFVKPIEEILKKKDIHFVTKHYSEITKFDLTGCNKIIICGTSLKDNQFLNDLDKFDWITIETKQILGICAGMQIIGLHCGGKLKNKAEIGYYTESFKNFLGLNGDHEVYHLHNNYIEFKDNFAVLGYGDIVQAVKYRNLYGVLFHPEVRNKDLIVNFCNL